MKIALLAPLEESVPPKAYGGTELVVANLIRGLVAQGHDVTLLASGDSKTDANLIPIFPEAIRTLPESSDPRSREGFKYMTVGRILTHLSRHSYDVIHNHIGWRVLATRVAEIADTPMVTTLHGPISDQYQQLIYLDQPEANYITISNAQRKPLPDLNYVATVYNGIDVDAFRFVARPAGDYFAFLGRMSPEKGPKQAIQIAKQAGIKLKMAAKVDAVDSDYFHHEIEPLIDGDQIQFVGEVGHDAKVDFLGNALGLLAPIQWEEPFGLFFVEAMACGTPVFTLSRGSAPEVIKDAVTGFVCHDEQELATKIIKLDTISRSACRNHVETNFSIDRMTDGYIQTYQSVRSMHASPR